MKSKFFVLLLNVFLVACGGGSNTSTPASLSLALMTDSFGLSVQENDFGGGDSGASGADGSAGDGKPIANASVVLLDLAGNKVTGTTDDHGYYRVRVDGFVAPIIANVTRSDGRVWYSPSITPVKVRGFITININGLTDKLASDVAIAAGLSGAASLTPAILAANLPALSAAKTKLNAELATQISAAGLDIATFDPVNTAFRAVTTDPYDKLLESVTINKTGTSPTVISRSLPAAFSDRKAIGYGPYRTAKSVGHPFLTNPNTPQEALLNANGQCIPDSNDRANEVLTDANIAQDMQLLSSAGFGLVRLFDSSLNVAERTLRVIKANHLDIKVMLGAYVHSYPSSLVDQMCKIPSSDVVNDEEIARTITLANDYKDIVLAVSIGNESMVSWSHSPVAPAKVASYIATVRSKISQPVTADDDWSFYADTTGANDVVLNAIDFVSIHTSPLLNTVDYSPNLWNWMQKDVAEPTRAQAMMSAAVASSVSQFDAVTARLQSKNLGHMPVVIGEIGWKAADATANTLNQWKFRVHPVNQKMFLDKLAAWASAGRAGPGPKAIFYFEAFDEPWKKLDDNWGLFNVKREARYAIQALLQTGSTAWVNEAGSYTDSDAVYWLAPPQNAAIDAAIYSRYTLYSDATKTGELVAPITGANAFAWSPWEGTVVNTNNFKGSGTTDGPNALRIEPTPASWGWGVFFGTDIASRSVNLSQFATNGRLQFDIKTAYPGNLEVGFKTNTASNTTTADAYILLISGNYGYVNDGNWHHVSIPITDLVKDNKADLSMVIHTFVLSDRFYYTGNALGTGLPGIYVDSIFISAN